MKEILDNCTAVLKKNIEISIISRKKIIFLYTVIKKTFKLIQIIVNDSFGYKMLSSLKIKLSKPYKILGKINL